MTIDEAISHALEVASENDSRAAEYNEHDEWESANKCNCEQCAADHRQLAEWLTELKQWRKVCGCGCCGSPWVTSWATSDDRDGGIELAYDEEKCCYRVDLYKGYDYHEPIYVYGNKEG